MIKEKITKGPKNPKYDSITCLLFGKTELEFTDEDKQNITRLLDAYWKKRKGEIRTNSETLAAAILWQYSKLNGLWEEDKLWSQQGLASLYDVRPKTIGANATEITRLLKIANWDDRFCRREIADTDPLKNMVVLANGMITSRDMAISDRLPFAPLKKTKEDYYYDGCDMLEGGNSIKATYFFKKALQKDPEYVDAWNGMGTATFQDKLEKSKEYFQKAYDLSLKHFNGKFPDQLEWGVL